VHFSATLHDTLEQEIELQRCSSYVLNYAANAASRFSNACVAKWIC